jgi:hypothetical protein
MSGVEILYTYPYIIEDGYSIVIGFCAVIGIAILAFLFFVVITDSSHSACLIASVVVGFLIGIPFGYTDADSRKIYGEEYKVTISDEVSMNEFLEKYEIIDQEGKIYTVREREIEE